MSFLNCLRIAVIPDGNEDKRIADVLEFCKKYDFGNVMLFINAEEFNVGHMTISEAKPFVEVMKKAEKIFRKESIGVSLNCWITIGHLARGRKLKDGQDFTLMTDKNGLRSELVACPLDENWKNYYFGFMEYLLREIKADVFWIEDDFRLHNHAPLEYGGCFCEKHVTLLNEELGTSYSREELCSKIFSKGKANAERKAWFDVNRREMVSLAADFGKKIREISPETQVGLMSSLPAFHAMEMRDWNALTESFAAGGKKIDRIHLPCYEETCGKVYGFQFAASSVLVRSLLPDDTEILPELENGSFSPFTKNARFVRFQLESSLPLLPSGMTYDIFDFVGNGTLPYLGYGECIGEISSYLNGFCDLKLSFSERDGIILPFDEKTSRNRPIAKDGRWQDLLPDENQVAGYLSQMGINFRFDTAKRFCGKTVFLCGYAVDGFTDEQLKDLFEDNFVVVEGGAVLRLTDRGLGYLIRCKSAERLSPNDGAYSYEQAAESVLIDGIKDYRASSQEKAGDYVLCRYDSVPNALGYVKNYRGETVGFGFVREEKFAVIPYVWEGVCFSSCIKGEGNVLPFYEQFNRMRVKFFKDTLSSWKSDTLLVLCEQQGVSPYLFRYGNSVCAILVNYTVETFPSIDFTVENIDFSELFCLDRDGKLHKEEFTRENNNIVIPVPFEYLSTKVLIFR